MDEDLIIEDVYKLAYLMAEKSNKMEEDFFSICTICNYDIASALIKELLTFDDTSVGSIKILSEEINGYDKEYFVSLNEDGTVWCEPAYHETNENHTSDYFDVGGDCVFIHSGCSSCLFGKTLDDCEEVICFSFEDEIEYDEDDDNTESISEGVSNHATILLTVDVDSSELSDMVMEAADMIWEELYSRINTDVRWK